MTVSIRKLTLAAVAAAATAAPASALEIKSSDVHPMGYPTTDAIEYMGQLLSDWTNGRITIKIFHSMQLGGEKEALEQVQLGALEMTRVSVGVVGPIVPDFNVFNLPYVFRSLDQMHNVVDGEIGTALLDKLSAGGLIGLGYMDAGSRSFYNKTKAIETPADLAGMKIRVMQNPIFVDMVNALGGNGLPIAYNELYTAMQTGVVDGAENNPPSYESGKHYEVAGYYTIDEHLMVPEIFVFSKKVWDTLDEVDRQLIRNASVLAARKERELWAAREKASMDILREKGVTIVENVDKTPFIEATKSVREKHGADYADLLKRIEATK
ncbi:TRAP transporter substrate-binding protein [Microbaculum marinum]|uniref:TRAP transporter substrate-binding protein n=1 Tax=Microbaculum marinum TaxID=1764581 RepID=A0AAW9RL12_9HYPH